MPSYLAVSRAGRGFPGDDNACAAHHRKIATRLDSDSMRSRSFDQRQSNCSHAERSLTARKNRKTNPETSSAAQLQDKVAILTGAASGIGEAVAKRYLDEGAKVRAGRCEATKVTAPAFQRDCGPRARLQRRRDAAATTSSASSSTVERFGRHRHSVQQRGALRHAPDPRRILGRVRPPVRGQREGHVLPDAGRRASDGRAGPRRQDHQHVVAGRAARRGAGLALLRDQGRRHQLYAVGRARARERAAST